MARFKTFRALITRRSNIPYKEIYEEMEYALRTVHKILQIADYDEFHKCCHVVTAIAGLQVALLHDDLPKVWPKLEEMRKFLEDATFGCYTSGNVINFNIND